MSLELEDIEEMDKVVEIVQKEGKRYIDEEEILLELKLVPLDQSFMMIFLFICGLAFTFSVIKTNDYENPITYVVIATCLLVFYIAINMLITFYKYKLYITENYFITYRGVKVHKNDIYLMAVYSPGGGLIANHWNFYKNNSLICRYYEGQCFYDVIYKISKNNFFYKDPITYDYKNMNMFKNKTKIKLMKNGGKSGDSILVN